jgi:hypothetical protein
MVQESLPIMQEALAIRREVFGAESEELAASLTAIADIKFVSAFRQDQTCVCAVGQHLDLWVCLGQQQIV